MVFCAHKYCLYLRQLGCASSMIQQSVLLGTLILVRLFENCNFWVWYVKKWERNWLDRPDQRVCDCLSVTALSRVLHDMWLTFCHPRWVWGILAGQQVKNLPAMQQTQVKSLISEDPLEKGMATHSSILAWRLSWTVEPGGLQSVGSQRAGHAWGTLTSLLGEYSCFVRLFYVNTYSYLHGKSNK